MSVSLRRAGTGRLPDGSQLVWSVADGRRGRRWRAVASANGAITHALLLEVGRDGRPSRLEFTSATGMLTLHRDETRRSVLGNVVTSNGMRHLSLPWSDEHGLEVEGQPIAAAVTASRLAGEVAVGEGRAVRVVLVAPDLVVSEAARRYVRVGEWTWRIEPESSRGLPDMLRLDERGIPGGLQESREWPLELD